MENLNYVDITMLILFVILLVEGCYKGFILSVINLVRSIAGYALCFFASAKLSPIIYDKYVSQWLNDRVSKEFEKYTHVDAIVTDIRDTINNLPAYLQDVVDTSKLDTVSQDNAVGFMMDNVVSPVANIAIKIVVFVVVFILFFVLTSVIINLIKKLRDIDKSSLKATDRIIGGAFGVAKFVVIVFAFITVVNMIAPYTTTIGDGFIAAAKSSVVYNFVNEHSVFDVIMGGI